MQGVPPQSFQSMRAHPSATHSPPRHPQLKRWMSPWLQRWQRIKRFSSPPGQGSLWIAVLSHLPQSLPESFAVITGLPHHPIRCQAGCRGLLLILVFEVYAMLNPPLPSKAGGKTIAIFVRPSTFHQEAAGCRAWAWGRRGLNLSQTETSSASPHPRLCQLEISLETHKGGDSVHCERQTLSGYRCQFFPPLTTKVFSWLPNCFICLSPCLLRHHTTYHTVYLSPSPTKK